MRYPEELSFLFTRRSIRRFSSRPVSEADINTILRAAMASPSSRDEEVWRFIVIDRRDVLDALPSLHPSAGPAKDAPLAILLCADIAAEAEDVFWPQDCAAATQNMLLAARALGLGSLWCGIHPLEEREEAFRRYFGIPGMVRPFSLTVIGWPLQEFFEEDRWDASHVHLNSWAAPYPA